MRKLFLKYMHLQKTNKAKKQNKLVLITGSGHGLGRELALVFASHGYDVVLNDRNKNDLEESRKKVSQTGVNYFVLLGDIRSDKTLDSLYEISKKKGISVLINNAGVHCPKLPLQDLKNEQIDDMMMSNLIAPIRLTWRLYPLFLENGQGTIININSLSGLENQKFRTIYSAAKWGLRGFSDSLKLETGENTVRVLDIYPSRMKTRPEFTFGMEPQNVARKIYEVYKNTDLNKIILDHRPKKCRRKKF